ncbi:hypothetical protein N9917_05135 [Deltaproteobacteria bacterium]|nr:hypothetical protein [Deltaproteobacteria bacterium]
MAYNDAILNSLEATVNKLKTVINPSIRESVDKNKNVIKTAQTDEQMFSGITAGGSSIRPFPYAKSTINYKRKKGQPTDRITLKDSGDFYDSIEVESRPVDFIISTQITYSIFLVAKYADILGLTAQNLTLFVQNYTMPIIKKNYNDIIAES